MTDFQGGLAMSNAEFHELRQMVHDLAGISIGESKRPLLSRRIQSRLDKVGADTCQQYISVLKQAESSEIEFFINAVTTNLTSFFRESHHFDFLAQVWLPEQLQRKGAAARRMRIWSAGCSTGEEPYSIAMVLREGVPGINHWDARILATDIDSAVLETAKAGRYPVTRAEKIEEARLSRWCDSDDTARDSVRIKTEIAELIRFRQLNLMSQWPMRGKFDAIFCRNVLIYFDKDTQRGLVDRFADILEPGGILFIGHSESLFKVSDRFELLGNTMYRKLR